MSLDNLFKPLPALAGAGNAGSHFNQAFLSGADPPLSGGEKLLLAEAVPCQLNLIRPFTCVISLPV